MRLKARVLNIVSEEERIIPGTEAPQIYQSLRAEIIKGAESGKIILLENDYLRLKAGEVFYLLKSVSAQDGSIHYTVADPDRIPALLFFIFLFVCLVFIFGGWQGMRGLVSLAGSLLLILFVLLPAILNGYPPILVSITVSSAIVIIGSYITHGFNKTTSAAVLGMVITVLLTGLLSYLAVYWTKLTGFETEEAAYLHLNTRGLIDLRGLLLGGIIIGLLGVLYDAAISQAIAVEELHHVAPHVPRRAIFRRALRIGREHIGALVDTLAIAYVGASLPLLLLFYADPNLKWLETVNREIFATEIIRTMIGSIGLVLAVPITTWLAALILVKRRIKQAGQDENLDPEKLATEERVLEHAGHHHSFDLT